MISYPDDPTDEQIEEMDIERQIEEAESGEPTEAELEDMAIEADIKRQDELAAEWPTDDDIEDMEIEADIERQEARFEAEEACDY